MNRREFIAAMAVAPGVILKTKFQKEMSDITIFTLSGSTVQAAFPAMRIIDTIKAQEDYIIQSLEFSGSMLNYGPQIMGFCVVLGQDTDTLTFDVATKGLAHASTFQNSQNGPPMTFNPKNFSGPVYFPCKLSVPSGSPISLYGFGDATVNNDFTGLVTLFLSKKS